MRYIKRKYETPARPWDRQKIDSERIFLTTYGLKNKRELWKVEAVLRKFRRLARELAASENKEKENIIIDKLIGMGVLESGAGIDDILAITTNKLLDRRLQTVLQRKGLANTIKHARQMIVHGKVKVGDRRVIFPSYMVSREEEGKISVIVAKPTVKVEKNAEEDKATEGTGTAAA